MSWKVQELILNSVSNSWIWFSLKWKESASSFVNFVCNKFTFGNYLKEEGVCSSLQSQYNEKQSMKPLTLCIRYMNEWMQMGIRVFYCNFLAKPFFEIIHWFIHHWFTQRSPFTDQINDALSYQTYQFTKDNSYLNQIKKEESNFIIIMLLFFNKNNKKLLKGIIQVLK